MREYFFPVVLEMFPENCTLDCTAHPTMPRPVRAEAHEQFTDSAMPSAREFPLAEGDRSVAVDSGYGDGGHPACWGVDAHGDIAQLVVDFMVLVSENDTNVLSTCQPQWLERYVRCPR
ncbi:hypothetical protein [Propionibacterium sp.]|uniref:hypothetical protein n=1 Tax=Propionibacterium sp. TaxID=1977903 RepID=UPI0039EA60BB